MKYLAVVESALIPNIKSHAGATGLWQFMFGTGKLYDLKVSSYVDERQDPLKSTIAACEYLSRLYKVFGDWDLVLAAYNSGPGNVLKAIKRSGGQKNYWNIRQFLPRETASYVPAFYATMYIFEYAEEHQLYPNMPRYFDFETDTVQVKKTVSFDQISEIIGLEKEVLTFLNPSYKLKIIPFVENRNYALRLPKHKIIDFLDKEHEIYDLVNSDNSKKEKPLPENFTVDTGIRYKVKSGDNLGKIAMKYGVRIKDIIKWNNLRSITIDVGQKLTIHPKKNIEIAKEEIKKTTKNTTNTTENGKFDIYTVKEGDSLWIISKKFDKVSIDDLKKWNNIWNENILKPGMKLKIFKS
jgi:membrane-bound lytic murein transglycosylase D